MTARFSATRGKIGWLCLLLALLAVVLTGCSPAKDTQTQDTGSATTGSGNGESKDEPKEEPEDDGLPKAADLSTLPADLSASDAFQYYGLGRTEALKYEVKATDQPDRTGEQKVVFTGMKDGKALFSVIRLGDLSGTMGNQELELTKEGLYTTGTSLGTVPKPSLELPLSLKTGSTWKSSQKLESHLGQQIETSSTYKVVGPKKVKTKAGDFDALLVTAKGKVDVDGQKIDLEMTQYLAKGYGAVKTEISTKQGDGRTSKVSIELVD